MSAKATFDSLPVIISTLSAGLLCLSVVYDFGYFSYLGFSFAEAPTTIADHIRSSLLWLPTTALIIFGVFVFELVNRRVEQGMTEEELIESSPTPRFTKWFRDSPKYLIIALALSVPVSRYFGIKLPLQAWQFSLIIIWFIAHNWFFSHPRILERSSTQFFLLSRWVPAVAIFVAFQGVVAAELSIGVNAKQYKIEFSSKKLEVFLLRTFDEYLLVWHPKSKRHEFIPTSSIRRFSIKTKENSNKKTQPTAGSGG